MRRLSQRDLLANIDSLTDIYNRSMTDHWGFVPISCDEVRYLVRQIRHLLVPEFTLAAEIDGRFVAFTIGLPDYNQRLKQIGGRLFPFGFLRLLGGRRQINCLRMLDAHVAPEYRAWAFPRAAAPWRGRPGVRRGECRVLLGPGIQSFVAAAWKRAVPIWSSAIASIVGRHKNAAVVMPDAVAAPVRSVREAVPQLA